MSKIHFFVIFMLALLSRMTEVQGQILWEHKTSSAFINPVTQAVDSELCFTSISCYGNTCIAGGLTSNIAVHAPYLRGTFYKSTDGGNHWFEVAPPVYQEWPIPEGATKVQMIDELHIVAISDYGTVHYSNDGAKSWQRRDIPVRRELFDVHFSDSLTGIITCVGKGSYDSMKFTTTNGGLTWKDNPLPISGKSVRSIDDGIFKIYKYGHGPIYTFNDKQEILDSTEQIYTTETDPKYSYVIGWVRFGKGDTLFGHGWFNPKDSPNSLRQGLIIRSTDGGKSWDPPFICPPLTINEISSISSVDRDTVIAGGHLRPYYAISFDRGATWKVDSITIDTPYVTDQCFAFEMTVDGSPLASMGPYSPLSPRRNVIVKGKFQTTGIEVIETIRYHTRLYPNPSSGVVNIESIDKSGAGITVIDILGREVYQGKLASDGTASLDLRHLPKGLYYIVFNHYGKEFIAGKVALME